MNRINFIHGDCREKLSELPSNSFDACVTSPPYYKQRDYRHVAQIGNEGTVEGYIDELVDVFRLIARVLKPEAAVWLNLGDKYINKKLQGIPWRVALALQDWGWLLRSAVIWEKPNVKPQSVSDRPTSSYEHIFLLSQHEKYYYDADALREKPADYTRAGGTKPYLAGGRNTDGLGKTSTLHQMAEDGRNRRDVWAIPTVASDAGGHFAVMPPQLAKDLIVSICPPGGHVIDPFGGLGTTGLVAYQNDRDATIIELNESYFAQGMARVSNDAPLLWYLDKQFRYAARSE